MFPQGTVMDGLSNIAVSQGNARIQFPRPGEVTPQPSRSRDNSPHEITLGVVYVNDIGRPAFTKEPSTFAVGSIIVRETMTAQSSNPEGLVVMVKRAKHFNPKANDWEFLTVRGDLKKIMKREKEGKCLGCHATAAKTDFVFPENTR
jgi:hypothetical protein